MFQQAEIDRAKALQKAAVPQPPTFDLQRAADAVMAMATAYERRPCKEQAAGRVSLLLTTQIPRRWRPAVLGASVLRTHDSKGLVESRVLLQPKRMGRDSAVQARRTLIQASATENGAIVVYAQTTVAVVVPRQDYTRATVAGDPRDLQTYSSGINPNEEAIRQARRALGEALRSHWPADGSFWTLPRLKDMAAHQRIAACAEFSPEVGSALAAYEAIRVDAAKALTIGRAGGLLLFFLPHKNPLNGHRLIDIQRA